MMMMTFLTTLLHPTIPLASRFFKNPKISYLLRVAHAIYGISMKTREIKNLDAAT